MRKTGEYKALGSIRYFIPYSLPPQNPPLALSPELVHLHEEVMFALGKLNELSARIPNPQRFIKAYVIKEALLTSAIEGIHTTLIDVFTYTLSEEKPNKDTQLVLNYTKALDVALRMMQVDKMPLVERVIRAAHEALLSGGENENKNPGHYRKQSVRVGDLVPPPAQEIAQLMSNLEKYINEPSNLPLLVRAGLVHVHFETIHPFLDGNGRIGRLLIVLMLIDSGYLQQPILYPSYYFKKYRLAYYQHLDDVRTKGDFESWIAYYLQAMKYSIHDAHIRAQDIERLEHTLKETIQRDAMFIKMRDTATVVLEALFIQPVIGIAELSEFVGKAYNTVGNIIKLFVQANIVTEGSVGKRGKQYLFAPYLALLEKEYSEDQ